MTLTRRLDRLADRWPHPADVLAARLGAELGSAAPRTLENSATLYRRCRALMATAGLSEPATARALAEAMIAVGFPEDGVRQCMADMPDYFVLAFACVGVSQMGAWRDASPSERGRYDDYLDSLLSDDERAHLNAIAERIAMTEPV